MKTFNYECTRSQRPEHQCNGLRAAYYVSGSVEAPTIRLAKDAIEPNCLVFMQAIPGVFTLVIMAGGIKRTLEYDSRPKPPEGVKKSRCVK